jgi:hypothetical protein
LLGPDTAVDPGDLKAPPVGPSKVAPVPSNVQLRGLPLGDDGHPLPPETILAKEGFVCASTSEDRVLNLDLMLFDHHRSGNAYQLWLWKPGEGAVVPPEELKVVTSIWWLSWIVGLAGIGGFILIGGLL